MTATQTPAAPGGPLNPGIGVAGEAHADPGFHRDRLAEELDRQHAAGLPLLDNVSDGSGPDWDGARCDECGTPVADDAPTELCDDCQQVDEEPHPYVCPTCGGNGCRVCAGTGELVEWVQ